MFSELLRYPNSCDTTFTREIYFGAQILGNLYGNNASDYGSAFYVKEHLAII